MLDELNINSLLFCVPQNNSLNVNGTVLTYSFVFDTRSPQAITVQCKRAVASLLVSLIQFTYKLHR